MTGLYWLLKEMLNIVEDMAIEALEENAERAAALLRSIGSKWRLLILCQLVKGEKSVGELERIIGLSQSALSQHLMVLRRNDLVKTRRAAQMIYYSLDGAEVPAILNTLYNLYCGGAGGTFAR
jgi:DNA-binding transcriptional ArsR family regulator